MSKIPTPLLDSRPLEMKIGVLLLQVLESLFIFFSVASEMGRMLFVRSRTGGFAVLLVGMFLVAVVLGMAALEAVRAGSETSLAMGEGYFRFDRSSVH